MADGVLYEQNASNELITLISYPAQKTESTFVVPSTVSTIEGYAFNGSNNLIAIYISSDDITIESNAFTLAGKNSSLVVYTENDTVVSSSSLIKIYHILSNDNYNVSDDGEYTISLIEDVEYETGSYFAKIDNDGEFILVKFEIVSGETPYIKSQNVESLSFKL